ncbi:GntR family transcriptional regulator [Salmonella enterica subsp. enterica]|uniref:GntR family transcriptional regulator n=1 Tax=Salmonella enterica I TaxID=59201 RepID=A0A379WJE1_SALET|nr:GntR family transcriptional regulator [Salmonella enterica subsp. enterica]
MQVDKRAYPLISNYFLSSVSRSKWIPAFSSQLPTQKEIARAYNVSLIVVKQAWSELINAGIISSQRGSGSVVCSVPEGVSYGHTFRGITRDLQDASVAIENRILEIAPRRAPRRSGRRLDLPAQHHYLYISRIRCLNNRPFNMRKYISISASSRSATYTAGAGAYVALFVIKRHKRLGDRKS